jgi:hypothetical protein
MSYLQTARCAQAVLVAALLVGLSSGGWLSPLLTRPGTLPSVSLRNGTRLVYRDFDEACQWIQNSTADNATVSGDSNGWVAQYDTNVDNSC